MAKEKLYVCVQFGAYSQKLYWYLSDYDVKIGDSVVVPVANEYGKKVAQVKQIKVTDVPPVPGVRNFKKVIEVVNKSENSAATSNKPTDASKENTKKSTDEVKRTAKETPLKKEEKNILFF